ncbi:MAG: hypothetical protein ISR76_10090, partial [Planctomycetes bacterium]|nr:hypothetical protein [Planctomycetota bacterium]
MLFAAAILSLAQGGALPPDSAPPDPVLLAVTRSGVRVEVGQEPNRGALEVQTPYGVLSTPTDPVAVVLRSTARRDWLTPAFDSPGRASTDLIESLNADGRIGELMELAEHAKVRWTGPEDGLRLVAALSALEGWGARLRMVPPEVAWEDQTEWLWEQILRERGPRVHLLTGALVEALPVYSGTSTLRRLPSSALADGRDHRRPEVRRATALAEGKQTDADRLRLLFLL